MTDYLTILRAVYSGLSQRQAAATYRVSRNTVALLVRYAKDKVRIPVKSATQFGVVGRVGA